MPSTALKGYTVPTTGSETGTWGDDLNTNFTNFVDQNLGGITTLSLTSSPVTLSAAQSRTAVVRCTGAILAPITITTVCVGFTFVENLTTGAFALTFANSVSGVVIPQGSRATVITDTTNGARVASSTEGFVSGFKMLAFQTAAPTSWTKDVTLDQATIRLVSGAVGADGGTSNFLSVFTARTILQANLPNITLTALSAGAHTHNIQTSSGTNNTGAGISGNDNNTAGATNNDAVVSGGIHTHDVPLGGSGTAMDYAVKYADAIRIIRN